MRRASNQPRPWQLHLSWIAAALTLATVYVGFEAFVYIDEAAVYAQAEMVGDGTWTVRRPLASADDAERWAPMNNSTVVGDEFAPFPNHPLHVIIASAAHEVAGPVGVRVLSTLGALLAAATAGILGATVGRREALTAAAIAALASPLLFDAQLVVAHALAAPLAGALVIVAFARPAAPLLVRALGAVALAAAGSLLRSEFVVFALVVAAVLLVTGFTNRRRDPVVVSVAMAVGGMGAYLLEPAWVTRLIGESVAPKVISAESRGGVSGRLDSVVTVLVGTGPGRSVALVLAVVLAGIAVALARWRPEAVPVAALTSIAAAAMGVLHLTSPTVVPGILWAFPLATTALLSARRGHLSRPLRQALMAAAVFAGVVLVVQYRQGGGFEWGWRYVAIALPVVSAAMAAPVRALIASTRTLERRIVVAGVLAVAILVPVSGVMQQRRHVEATEDVLDSVEQALENNDAELIVSTERLFGRYVWEQSIAGRVVTGTREGLPELLSATEAAGYERILLVWAGSQPDVPRSSSYSLEDDKVPLAGPFDGRILRLSE